MLQASGLMKHFGGQKAVNGLDFSVEQGEIRCLIGPNGAGKSTALSLLAGQLRPSAGRIVFDGQDIAHAPAYIRARLGISIKFQLPNVFPELSVRQNLDIAFERHAAGPLLKSEVDRVLSILGLAHRSDERARKLSHGEKQWLELGLAIGIRPRLLLLDEPTAGMTPEETVKTGELIKRLNQDGMTIIAVEHDMHFVRQIARTVTVMNLGQVFFEGTLDQVLSDDKVADLYFGRAA